jgi:hypothetical protein
LSSGYESRIERQIREAQERGEFDNLPGAGKPLPDRGTAYDEDWWIKDPAGPARAGRRPTRGPAHLRRRRGRGDLAAAPVPPRHRRRRVTLPPVPPAVVVGWVPAQRW